MIIGIANLTLAEKRSKEGFEGVGYFTEWGRTHWIEIEQGVLSIVWADRAVKSEDIMRIVKNKPDYEFFVGVLKVTCWRDPMRVVSASYDGSVRREVKGNTIIFTDNEPTIHSIN